MSASIASIDGKVELYSWVHDDGTTHIQVHLAPHEYNGATAGVKHLIYAGPIGSYVPEIIEDQKAYVEDFIDGGESQVESE